MAGEKVCNLGRLDAEPPRAAHHCRQLFEAEFWLPDELGQNEDRNLCRQRRRLVPGQYLQLCGLNGLIDRKVEMTAPHRLPSQFAVAAQLNQDRMTPAAEFHPKLLRR